MEQELGDLSIWHWVVIAIVLLLLLRTGGGLVLFLSQIHVGARSIWRVMSHGAATTPDKLRRAGLILALVLLLVVLAFYLLASAN
jgi:hypothetical protein